MANTPQKTKDATEEALSAIQEALSIRAPEPRTGAPYGSAAEADASNPPASATSSDLFQQDAAGGWPAGDTTPRRAANDDRAGIGQILQTLRHRTARAPYVAAAIVGFIWAAGGIAIATLYSSEIHTASAGTGFAAMVAITAAIAVPVTFFFLLAHMFNRAQDMRVVAESMAEVAMRLAQPETVARESIVTVGQAIRREVAAMGDGVERALARAAELEALVHNEVSALERAYNDNEVRIRDLLTELSNQRETLVNQAEQVRNAIASVHLDLAHDITSVGDLVADKVNEVAQRVTRSLTEKGEHITLALGHAGDSMIDALSERGSTLLDRLETTSDHATTAISSASDRLSASLNFKTEHVHDEFADLAARLQQMMSARLDQVAQSFAQKSSVTIETMATRSQQFTDAITEFERAIGRVDRLTRRRGQYDPALHRRLPHSRPVPARQRCRLETGANRQPHHGDHYKPQQCSCGYLPRQRRSRLSRSSTAVAMPSRRCWRRVCRPSRKCSIRAARKSPRRSPATPATWATSSPATSPSSITP